MNLSKINILVSFTKQILIVPLLCCSMWLFADSAASADLEKLSMLNGQAYLAVAKEVQLKPNAKVDLDTFLLGDSGKAGTMMQARILLARLTHPDVFSEFSDVLLKWRQQRDSGVANARPGHLCGELLAFVRRGPENPFVEERVGRKTWSEVGPGGNQVEFSDAVYKKVEKYSSAEVSEGQARNAAARLALLEHFLKFWSDLDPSEKAEVVEAVDRLWGAGRNRNAPDYPVIDFFLDAPQRVDEARKRMHK